MSACRSVVITGSNRGLGLEFVKQFLALPQPPSFIFATCRDAQNAKELQSMADSSSKTKVIIHQLDDVTSPNQIQSLVETVGTHTGGDLNLLINNAGVAEKGNRSFLDADSDCFARHFATNSIGPVMIAKAFLPLLSRAAKLSPTGSPMNALKCGVVNLGTKMASITDNSSGGSYPYRMSKVALHMATRSMAMELKKDGILVLLLHPGWVRTDMGGPNGLIDGPESVSGMMRLIRELGEKDAGVCYDYSGKVVPW